MEFIKLIFDFIIHIDMHLSELIRSYGVWTYLILFLIIFCETGLVVAPLLPGDSLLFAAGTFAARGDFNIFWLFIYALRGCRTGRHGQLLDRETDRAEGFS